ncbi:beta-ketoacyl-[acyl-carrier-protein] synthase family protein [Streptosporangium saharense]|uniref:beta-ketoacyl-[acyl-carrier-protein] synthase family protein n=1 Tax=Streptosporangium saharense TaxID=1706840 RepID=UPI00331A7F97
MHRVVITGVGPVSSIGVGAAEFEAALRAGKSGISPIRSFDSSGFEHRLAGEVQDFDPAAYLTRISPDEHGHAALFAAVAARLAADDAGLAEFGPDTAVLMGTNSGEVRNIVALAKAWHHNGPSIPEPDIAGQISANRLALAAARELGATGETLTFGTACAAGNYAIGYAFDLLSTGAASVAIAGGADSVNRFTHAGFHRLGALAGEACRPFDRDRDGMLTAEGGVALVMETLDGARARGARIYAEVLGHAMTCDASHPTAPDTASIARCMRASHTRAGLTPSDIGYICAHGTGTRVNDQVETAAFREVFGTAIPPVSSIKSMLGHSMGAASGFGAVASVLALSSSFLPPTINHRFADPELGPLDPVPNEARRAELNVVQNNGFGFGGNNSITLFGRLSCES